MVSYMNGVEFAKPPRPDTLTPEAEEAREMVRRYGWRLHLAQEVASLVTDHGNPHAPAYDGEVVTAAARRLLRKAEAAGMTAQIVESPAACCVEAYDLGRGVAFRVWWVRGKAAGGTWHERQERWIMERDDREVRVNMKTKTGLTGYRTTGQGNVRPRLVASRAGIPMTVTEIERKISA